MTLDLPPILRAPLLAELLGLTIHTVNEMCRSGGLPASKLAGRWIVRRDAFVEFLQRGERAHRAMTSVTDPGRLMRVLPPPRRARREAPPCVAVS